MKRLLVLSCALLVGAIPLAASAAVTHAHEHHWPGTGERVIPVVDSVTSRWNTQLRQAAADWSESPVVAMPVVSGSASRSVRKRCPAPLGAVRVCNFNYGRNGWIGNATVYEDDQDHIRKVRIRLNSYYVDHEYEKQIVACHELGHALGIGHRSQTADSSCMTPNVGVGLTPDGADLDALALLYDHLDLPDLVTKTASVTGSRQGSYRVTSIKMFARN